MHSSSFVLSPDRHNEAAAGRNWKVSFLQGQKQCKVSRSKETMFPCLPGLTAVKQWRTGGCKKECVEYRLSRSYKTIASQKFGTVLFYVSSFCLIRAHSLNENKSRRSDPAAGLKQLQGLPSFTQITSG